MKKIILIIFTVIFVMSFQTINNYGPKIKFSKTLYNYGIISKGSCGNCKFEFINIGNKPLIVINVKSSCGCTTPTWTKKPIMPGKKGYIYVHYNTKKLGDFRKMIAVTTNAINEPNVALKIKGLVK